MYYMVYAHYCIHIMFPNEETFTMKRLQVTLVLHFDHIFMVYFLFLFKRFIISYL